MSVWDVVGLFGVAIYLSAHALLQLGKTESSSNAYLALNFIGSILIIISLLDKFNLPSFILQLAWLLLTIIGFFRAYRNRA